MPEDGATKVCPLCAETIKAAAKICPHCRKKQAPGIYISPYDMVAILSFVAFLLFAVLLTLSLNGRRFSPNRDRIDVLKSHAEIQRTQYSTNLLVVGILTNSSDFSWTVQEFEVRFIDSKGVVLADNGDDDVKVLPHADHAFRFYLYGHKALPKYDLLQVRVTSAFDPRPFSGF